MRILITNDDGIGAPGLEVLERVALEVAGPDGEVWTVAPANEQSGVGHCISYTMPTTFAEVGSRRYAMQGSPADCVLGALHDILPEQPDLILSGVNRGNNAAENVLYSGTVGAAVEGALQHRRAIALSQFYGPGNKRLDDPFEAAGTHGAEVIRRLLSRAPWDEGDDYRLFYNVNFPPVPADGVRGMAAAAQGRRPDGFFRAERLTSPSGRPFLWTTGADQHIATAEGTDNRFNLDGWISVTPCRCDLTAHDRMDALKEALS